MRNIVNFQTLELDQKYQVIKRDPDESFELYGTPLLCKYINERKSMESSILL